MNAERLCLSIQRSIEDVEEDVEGGGESLVLSWIAHAN